MHRHLPAITALALALALFLVEAASAPAGPPPPRAAPDKPAAAKGDPSQSPAATAAPPESAIRVVVGPSTKEPEPVGVPEVICAGPGKKTCARITAVLRRDLNLSGVFRVVDPKSYLAGAVPAGSAVPFRSWFDVGARYLVQGKVGGKGEEARVALSLYDVVQTRPIPIRISPLPEGRTDDLLMQVHRHVNAFMKATAGREGLFGTPILFVRKHGSGSKSIQQIRFGDPSARVRVRGGTSNLFPSLGPGGALLYTSFKRDKPDLYLGGKLLTPNPYEYRSARFSPGGKVIAVSVDRGDGQSDIWLMSPAGKLQKNLTRSPWDEVSPRWSHDGRQIAYVGNKTGSPQIYVMNADGSGRRRVTMAGGYNTTPDFGPTGNIVFAGLDAFVSEIFVTDLSGNIERITQLQGSNKDPAWSPDGHYLVFVSTRSGHTRLIVSTEDGRWQFPLLDAAGVYSTPYWGR